MDVARCMFYMPALRYRTFRTIRILFHALFYHFPPSCPSAVSLLSHLSFLVEAYMSPSSFLAGMATLTWSGSALKSTSFHCDGRSDWQWPKSESQSPSHRPWKRRGAERTKEMGLTMEQRQRACTHWRVLTVIIQWYLTADIAGQGHHHSCGIFSFASATVNGSIFRPLAPPNTLATRGSRGTEEN